MTFDVCLPILGLEDVKQVSLEKIDDIFMRIQAVGKAHISLTMVDPFVLREYDFEIPTKVQEMLDINENSNLIILNIVLIQKPIENSVVNFIGPMVFNTDNKRAAQIILTEPADYGVAEKISDFLKK